ncbi:hypothetical protein D3C75_946180 [compost metagenome]
MQQAEQYFLRHPLPPERRRSAYIIKTYVPVLKDTESARSRNSILQQKSVPLLQHGRSQHSAQSVLIRNGQS